MHRGRLVIAGAGVLVSGVVIASAIAMAGPGKTASGGSVTPTLAAGAATQPALQPSGLGAAGPVSSSTQAGTGAGHPAGTRLSTPPPLVNTAGDKNQVMITTATQPLAPDQAPGARPNAGAPAAGGTTAAPGTLQLSAGAVVLGGGSTGQLTLTAAGGTVSWSASVNPPDQVSLSSYGSTLSNGQQHHGDSAGQPGHRRGQRGYLLPGAGLGHAGNPGHLVGGAAGRLRLRFRLGVAPPSVAARAVAFVGNDVQQPPGGPVAVRVR